MSRRAVRERPTGFVARCRCGVLTGALDAERAGSDMGRILGKWLMDGCTVEPRFAGSWSADVEPCHCATPTPESEDR